MKRKTLNFIIAFVLVVLTLVNYFYMQSEQKVGNSNKRMKYTKYSNALSGKKIRFEYSKSRLDRKIKVNDLKIVIVLSNNSCNPCQIRELKNVQVFSKRRNIAASGLYVGKSDLDAKLLARYVKREIEIDLVKNFRIGKLKILKYPVILLVKGDKIIKGFFPIPGDKQFSLNFYESL